MSLQPHQVRAAEQFVKHCTNTGMLLWHRMGTGKTNTVLATLMNYPHDRVLLLLPSALKDVWVQEIQQKFNNAVPFQLQYMNYNTFSDKHMQAQVKQTIQQATLVVAEEAHHLVENKQKSLQLLRGKRCLLITGTPIYYALTDLAVLVNLAAGSDVLSYSQRKLHKLVVDGAMVDKIKNYVQFYDFAADANSQVIYPAVRVVTVTVHPNQLPVPKKGSIVYSQHQDKLRAIADKLQQAGVTTLHLHQQDQRLLDLFKTGQYVLLLDPAVAEGVTVPNATTLHVLEPVHPYGLQQQLYARVKRPVKTTGAKPMHTIYQYVRCGEHVDNTLDRLVRNLQQQMGRQQTSPPTCGIQVRDCDVWKSSSNQGTCASKNYVR